MVDITGAEVRRYIATRQEAGAKNATINRELAALRRMFTLAVDAAKLLTKPKITMLQEDNARQGFFELEQFQAVLRHLPKPLQAVATFAYFTGWRRSEVLNLEWSRVDRKLVSSGWTSAPRRTRTGANSLRQRYRTSRG